MQTRNIVVNDDVYVMVCTSENTRTGFAHRCFITRNGFEIAKGRCGYINRTWEPYQYHSVMCEAISKVADKEVAKALKEFVDSAR